MYTIICQGALSKAGGKSSMQCFITFGNVLHMSRKGGDNKLPQHCHFMKTGSRAQKTIELRKSWRGSLHCWVVLGTFTNCGRLSLLSPVSWSLLHLAWQEWERVKSDITILSRLPVICVEAPWEIQERAPSTLNGLHLRSLSSSDLSPC